MRNIFGLVIVAVAVCGGLVAPSSAQTSVYTDRLAFNAASKGLSTLTFEGLVTGTGGQVIPSPGLTLQGVNFNAELGNLLAAAPITYGPTGTLASNGPTSLRITLPGNISAIGFDFALAGDPAPRTVTFTLASGEVFSRTSSGTTPLSLQFFGVTSVAPIPFLLISSANPTSTLVLDNVSFGQAAPEPGSLLLLGAGLLFSAGTHVGRITARRGSK